jgi:hypothetical protein
MTGSAQPKLFCNQAADYKFTFLTDKVWTTSVWEMSQKSAMCAIGMRKLPPAGM